MFANLFSVLFFAAAAVLPADVQTARELRLKSIREADAGQSVRLTGVVTFCPPRGKYFYLQDSTGGVRVEWLADRELHIGDRVEVRGKTTAGSFLPEVIAKRVTVLGKAELPDPVPFTLTMDDTPYLDGQWVEVVAVVQRTWQHDGWLKFDLARGRGNAVVYVPLPFPAKTEKADQQFRGSVVRIRGVCRVNANGSRQMIGPPSILVSELSAFEEVRPAPADPFALPVTTIRDLTVFRPDPIAARLQVRITGVVTLNQGTQFYVCDDTGVAHLSCIDSAKVHPGDRVSVVAFPRLTLDPIRLDNARVQVIGTAPFPPAVPGVLKAAADGKLEGQVARFTGRVVDAGPQANWMTLTVEAEDRKFTFVLLEEVTAGTQPPASPGSKVEVTGVVTRLPLGGLRRTEFTVFAKSDGLTIVEPPPAPPEPPPPSWWTGRRVAYLLTGFCGLFLLGGATVTALRVQVRRAAAMAQRQSEEKEKLQGQLNVAAKFEAVGRVAGGVAHDFNNILTVINGCAQLLDEEIASDPTHAATLAADIRRAGRLASAITHLLLAFSRQRPVAPHALDLNAAVADVAPILARLLGNRITLRVAPGSPLPPVLAETGMLLQVLINLTVNAGEAMPDGGTFTISTSAAEPGWVRLITADTGMGMTTEVKKRAFERGFTTKSAGTGTGLSTVHDIVQTLGGRLRVHSKVGRGTEFEIDLPTTGATPALLPASSPGEIPHDAATVIAAAGNEATVAVATSAPAPSAPVVLVVEDDDAVRSYVLHVLEQAGMHVLSATDPEQALRILAAQSGPVDLLITDLMMPGLSGRQLADRVRAARPGVRVLFMSGYDADNSPDALDENADFLHKPFIPRELTERVQRALGQPRG